jgi:hypothetical protein
MGHKHKFRLQRFIQGSWETVKTGDSVEGLAEIGQSGIMGWGWFHIQEVRTGQVVKKFYVPKHIAQHPTQAGPKPDKKIELDPGEDPGSQDEPEEKTDAKKKKTKAL